MELDVNAFVEPLIYLLAVGAVIHLGLNIVRDLLEEVTGGRDDPSD